MKDKKQEDKKSEEESNVNKIVIYITGILVIIALIVSGVVLFKSCSSNNKNNDKEEYKGVNVNYIYTNLLYIGEESRKNMLSVSDNNVIDTLIGAGFISDDIFSYTVVNSSLDTVINIELQYSGSSSSFLEFMNKESFTSGDLLKLDITSMFYTEDISYDNSSLFSRFNINVPSEVVSISSKDMFSFTYLDTSSGLIYSLPYFSLNDSSISDHIYKYERDESSIMYSLLHMPFQVDHIV